jgi:hypothetical protein
MRQDRKATVADQFLASGPGISHVNRRVVEHVRSTLKQAKKIVFDLQGSKRLAEVVRDIPELICREQEFARAPYQRTWFEFDFRTFWETVNQEPAAPNADTRLGFLIDHNEVYSVCGGAVMPISYELHQPWSMQEQAQFAATCRRSVSDLDIFMWGRVYGQLNQSQKSALRSHHRVRVLPLSGQLSAAQAQASGAVMFAQQSADLRNIIAVLLLLNRPSVTRYVSEVSQSRGFMNGKFRPYFAHSVVTIDIDPIPVLRKLGTPDEQGVQKRHHEVRGVYCHDEAYRKGRAAGCVHEWISHPKYVRFEDKTHRNPLGDEERDNWLCKLCNGHKWWRVEHSRGDATTGVVAKTYVASS